MANKLDIKLEQKNEKEWTIFSKKGRQAWSKGTLATVFEVTLWQELQNTRADLANTRAELKQAMNDLANAHAELEQATSELEHF